MLLKKVTVSLMATTALVTLATLPTRVRSHVIPLPLRNRQVEQYPLFSREASASVPAHSSRVDSSATAARAQKSPRSQSQSVAAVKPGSPPAAANASSSDDVAVFGGGQGAAFAASPNAAAPGTSPAPSTAGKTEPSTESSATGKNATSASAQASVKSVDSPATMAGTLGPHKNGTLHKSVPVANKPGPAPGTPPAPVNHQAVTGTGNQAALIANNQAQPLLAIELGGLLGLRLRREHQRRSDLLGGVAKAILGVPNPSTGGDTAGNSPTTPTPESGSGSMSGSWKRDFGLADGFQMRVREREASRQKKRSGLRQGVWLARRRGTYEA